MNMFKSNGGFTLVELIVVIAILAILAGVAVPAYSGYISRANEASDGQILEGIETAMIAALSMEGRDSSAASSYFTLTLGTDGKLTVAQNTATGAPADAADVFANFSDFYGTTTSAALKYYKTAADVPALLGITTTAK